MFDLKGAFGFLFIGEILMKKYLAILLVLLTALSIVIVSAQDEMPEREGLRPDAPLYAIRGSYWVGFANHAIEDEYERSLDAFIWYPALNTDDNEEEITYYLWELYFRGHALQDAEPNFENGPYPLIIFAHSANGWRMNAPYLYEHLASHGFVVMAILYQDNITTNGQPIYPPIISRPRDVSRQIDYAEELTADNGTWAGLIDIEQVGVTGHSAGGTTALHAGGARLDWDHFAERCETMPDPSASCPSLLGRIEDMAALAGWDDVPESPWPSLGDDRVDAIIPLAPGGRIFGSEGVADITVPVMLIGGTEDKKTLPEYNFYPIYEGLTAPKTMVLFEGAGHMIFALECADSPKLVDVGLFRICSDPVWDMARAHDLINHFVTAFFLAELYSDEDAAAALMPDRVNFPGITYETTMSE